MAASASNIGAVKLTNNDLWVVLALRGTGQTS